MKARRARAKRFGWWVFLGLIIVSGLYLTPLLIISRITDTDVDRLNRRSAPTFETSYFLHESGMVDGGGIHYGPRGFYLHPMWLDSIYRPVFKLAGRNENGQLNWAAVYLLGVQR